MFDFEEAANRRQVEAVLTSRINERCFEELCDTGRIKDRSSCVSVVCLVPQNASGDWDFDRAVPALSRDISQSGLSILHGSELTGELLVEVPRTISSNFVRCQVRHCKALGRGYFHAGMTAKEVVHVETADRNKLERRLSEFAGSGELPVFQPES